jgi:hypothetical protein
MSKPAFKLPERRIDEWVNGPTVVPPVEKPSEPKVKLARLTIDLDVELHAKFKAACAMRRTRMIDEVRGFIENYTQKSG